MCSCCCDGVPPGPSFQGDTYISPLHEVSPSGALTAGSHLAGHPGPSDLSMGMGTSSAPGFSLRQLPAAIPAQVPLGTSCCLCCNFSLCSVGLSLLLTGVILTAFPDKHPAIKPPSQRPSLEDQTQHPIPRQAHHVICASQSPQSLGKSKSLHVFFTILPILLTEKLRLRKEDPGRPSLTHCARRHSHWIRCDS